MEISHLEILKFGDKELICEIDGEMLNATRMGLPFGSEKSPTVWLNTDEAAGIRTLIASIKGCDPEELVSVKGDGDKATIWIDMGLGLPYAGWLLPEFLNWCAEKARTMKEEMVRERGSDAKNDTECHVLIGIRRSDDKTS